MDMALVTAPKTMAQKLVFKRSNNEIKFIFGVEVLGAVMQSALTLACE